MQAILQNELSSSLCYGSGEQSGVGNRSSLPGERQFLSLNKSCFANGLPQDLRKLIELDYISSDLFELAPLTEYEVYIKNYGLSGSVQASTQCNDSELVTSRPTLSRFHYSESASFKCRTRGSNRCCCDANAMDARAAIGLAWLRSRISSRSGIQ